MTHEDALILNKLRKEIKVKPKYRNDLAALIRLANPVIESHDMALKFTDYDYTDGMIQSTVTLIGDYDLKATSFARVDDTHEDIAYMARLNAMKTLLNIADYPLAEPLKPNEEPKALISERQAYELEKKVNDKGLNIAVVLKRFNVKEVRQLTNEQYQRALKGLEATCNQKR